MIESILTHVQDNNSTETMDDEDVLSKMEDKIFKAFYNPQDENDNMVGDSTYTGHVNTCM